MLLSDWACVCDLRNRLRNIDSVMKQYENAQGLTYVFSDGEDAGNHPGCQVDALDFTSFLHDQRDGVVKMLNQLGVTVDAP